MKAIMVYLDWPEAVSQLPEDAQGRLMAAMVRYARGDEDYAAAMTGPEAYLFPTFQLQIDRTARSYANRCTANRENGKKGGRPAQSQGGAENPLGFVGGEGAQEEAEAKAKEEAEGESKAKEESKAKAEAKAERECEAAAEGEGEAAAEGEATGACRGAAAAAAREDLALRNYAAENLGKLSPQNLEELAAYRARLPDALIRHAVDEACAFKVRKWAYVRSILERYIAGGIDSVEAAGEGGGSQGEGSSRGGGSTRGGGSPRGGGSGRAEPWVNPALNYQQREYRDEDFGDDFFEDLTKYVQEE